MSKQLEIPARSSDSYARFGMIAIARYRFQAFEIKFHREPGSHEPLFFDEFSDCPVKADLDTTLRQLAEAASASQVRLEPVLKFLGLAPTVVTKMRRAAKVSQSTKVPRRRPQSNASRRVGSGESRTWERFLADHRLHHRYAISGQELKMLSQVSFLGQVRTVDDFLSILKLIRKARE